MLHDEEHDRRVAVCRAGPLQIHNDLKEPIETSVCTGLHP